MNYKMRMSVKLMITTFKQINRMDTEDNIKRANGIHIDPNRNEFYASVCVCFGLNH